MVPRISVLLPVYNGEATIGRAVESIRGQTDPHWELIVLDDGSTDASAAEARRAAGGDGRIRIASRPHRGLVPALREACDLAGGDLLARMDADDVALPRRLGQQRAWFSAHPRGGLCGSRVIMAGAEVRSGRRRYESWLNALTEHRDIDREIFVECPIAHPAFMLERAALEAVGGYRDFEGPEDYDLVFRLWHAGYTLGNVPEVLLAWHDNPGRLSMTSPRYTERSFRDLKRHWLREARVGADRPLYQWGAGEVGKRWLREWPPGHIEAAVDIRPGKIGQTIHGHAVIRPEVLPPPGNCFILIAVGTPGARAVIRGLCARAGYEECRDYRFLA